MLAGWSPSLFKVLQTEGVVQWTPYQALRIQLDDVRYDAVRERLAVWQQANPVPIYDVITSWPGEATTVHTYEAVWSEAKKLSSREA